MASISRLKGGRRVIQFTDGAGNRKTIYLGKMSPRNAETIKLRVEALNAAAIHGLPIDSDTATWLADIGDTLADKLADVGLCPRRGTARLGEFMTTYIDGRGDVKEGTRIALQVARKRILKFFPPGRDLRDFTAADADAFLVWLKQTYAEGTAGRTVKRIRQFFRAAVRAKLIRENVFAEVKAPSEVNEARKFFVTRDVAAQVLEECPDAEWRLLFALSRYGGLRCPSEHFALEWSGVDWAKGRFLVDSPKTGPRWVPIFPELRPFLQEAYDLAPEKAVHVIAQYRNANKNLRTRMMRIIKRAGCTVWPKLFHNLRASRETELAGEFPIHVVVAWLGHSELIAQKHYLQVTDADFERAAKGAAPALQIATSRLHAQSVRHGAESTEGQEGAEVGNRSAQPRNSAQTTQIARRGLEPRTCGV